MCSFPLTEATATATNVKELWRRSVRPLVENGVLAACACLAITPVLADTVVGGQALVDEGQGVNWLSTGRTYSENHYSPLSAINSDNVRQLGLAWFVDLPGERTLEATPLAVEGMLYFSGTNGKAFAVDARTGRQIWKFDPEPGNYRPDIFRSSASAGGHRGVAYWQGKVYVGVIDGRLFALNARSGKPLWSVQTFYDQKASMAISGAPRVFNGKVVIGNGETTGPMRGSVTAYDAETGRQVWRFFTVPGDPRKGFENQAMRMAAKTWSGQWWKAGGGGAVWDAITFDPAFNRVYLGVGAGVPDDPEVRSPGQGDNLFTCSIVALDAETGNYVWHYQANPRDGLHYDSMQMVLADLVIHGKLHKVVMQASRNGFFYVLDRATGKLLSAEKFEKATWADRIDLKTGRPVETANIRYERGPVIVWPGQYGAHDWQSMSFNPATGLAYIPTIKLAQRAGHTGLDFTPRDADDGTGRLLAWDPVAQKGRWEVRYPENFWNGGTLTTAGTLVFQGTGRGQFIAYNARTGERLWNFNAGLGIVAAPMTYEVAGIQYVSVLVGFGGAVNPSRKLGDYGWHFDEQPRRLLTFALGRRTPLPPTNPPRYRVNAVNDTSLVIDQVQAAKGYDLVAANDCGYCHGYQLENHGSFAPDLRESMIAMNWEAFKSVVHDGDRASAGMPKFENLTEEDLRAIYMYIRQRAREAADESH